MALLIASVYTVSRFRRIVVSGPKPETLNLDKGFGLVGVSSFF